jgi:hypothetical protein
MPHHYWLHGTVHVRDSEDVRKIIDEYRSMCPGDMDLKVEEVAGDGTLTLRFAGSEIMSIVRACVLDDLVLSLGPHATRPCYVRTDFNGQSGHLYVVRPEQAIEFESATARGDAIDLLAQMTIDDLRRLRTEINQRIRRLKEVAPSRSV